MSKKIWFLFCIFPFTAFSFDPSKFSLRLDFEEMGYSYKNISGFGGVLVGKKVSKEYEGFCEYAVYFTPHSENGEIRYDQLVINFPNRAPISLDRKNISILNHPNGHQEDGGLIFFTTTCELIVDSLKVKFGDLEPSNLQKGLRVKHVHYTSEAQPLQTVEGSVLGHAEHTDHPTYIKVQMMVQQTIGYGDSGSPVFNEKGELLGAVANTPAPEGEFGNYYGFSIVAARWAKKTIADWSRPRAALTMGKTGTLN